MVAAWQPGRLYRRGERVWRFGIMYQAAMNIETDADPAITGPAWFLPDPLSLLEANLNTDGTIPGTSVTGGTGGGPHTHVEGDITSLAADLAQIPIHLGASDPHVAYALDADLANHEADTIGIHGIASTAALVVTTDGRLSDARAPTAHNHTEAQVTNLTSDLSGKAASAHSHAEADVTSLVTDLSGKAASGHNHDASYAPTHSHPYAATSHAHVDGDLPAGLARDAEVAAVYATIHSHPYEASGAVATHAGLADPHPGYLTPAEGTAAYEALGTVATHAAAGDPHPTYLTSAEGNAAYAALVHAHAPVSATLANGATAMAFGTNGSVKVTPTGNATYTTTVPVAGTHVHLIVLTAGASSFTITFGTGFKPSTTLATGTTAARVFVLAWLSDGTNLYEVSRTAALVA